MNTSILIFIGLVALLYIVSTLIHANLARLFSRAFSTGKFVVYLLWLLYLPGIVLHELAHLLLAFALLLQVRSINLLPTIMEDEEGKQSVKLGSVTYYKADPIRGLLVGIAPFFLGTFALLLLFHFIKFPNTYFKYNIFFAYVSFIISSTMFSSKKDLHDLLYVVPSIALLAIIFFALRINPFSYITLSITLQKNGINFLNQINQMFTLSLLINIVIYAIVKVIKR